jgi:FeS assembly SUF system protein
MSQEAETRQELAISQARMGLTAAPGIEDEDVRTLTDGIIAALRTVHDPEIPLNVYDLGLIYRIEAKDPGFVVIDMTLTAPGCPVAGEMLSWVHKAVSDVEGIDDVKVNLVFDPPWDKSRMSEEAKLELGLI